VINLNVGSEFQIDPNITESILAGVVGFYFGSRS
jgi:hypothetical protein